MGQQFSTCSSFTVAAGEQVAFVLTWHPSHSPRPTLVDPHKALKHTLADWAKWSDRCRYRGPYREAVIRSLIDWPRNDGLCETTGPPVLFTGFG